MPIILLFGLAQRVTQIIIKNVNICKGNIKDATWNIHSLYTNYVIFKLFNVFTLLPTLAWKSKMQKLVGQR